MCNVSWTQFLTSEQSVGRRSANGRPMVGRRVVAICLSADKLLATKSRDVCGGLCVAGCVWRVVCGGLCMEVCVWRVVCGGLCVAGCVWLVVCGGLCVAGCVWQVV